MRIIWVRLWILERLLGTGRDRTPPVGGLENPYNVHCIGYSEEGVLGFFPFVEGSRFFPYPHIIGVFFFFDPISIYTADNQCT